MELQGHRQLGCRRICPQRLPARLSKVPSVHSRRPSTPYPAVQAIHIDRRHHMELAWQRQEQQDAQLAQEARAGPGVGIAEVRNLEHLDQLVESAGSSVVAVAFYSRSCGACKDVMRQYVKICTEFHQQRAGVRFLKHDVRNEFDDVSDVARMFRIKAVPCFVFFVGGAKVSTVRMPDMRGLTGTSAEIRRLIDRNEQHIRNSLQEVLFKSAPSARR